MAKYRQQPVIIEAIQWWKNGDHHMVKPKGPSCGFCLLCGRDMEEHGRITTLEDERHVCPGDWIITGVKGEHYACKPDIFVLTYEKVELLEALQQEEDGSRCAGA